MKRLVLLMCVMLAYVGASADLQKDEMGNYLINTPADLTEFTLLVRSGNTSINAKLMADIDMSSENDFIPIGYYSDDSNHVTQRYSGTFNGNGHVIRNLTITMEDSYEVGLIGRGDNCVIKNLGVENAKMTSLAGVRTGVIGGELNNCQVENCFVIGNIEINTEHEQMGAIAAEAAGRTTFTNCFTTYDLLTSRIGGSMTRCFEGSVISEMREGELCFLLNGDQSHVVWFQNLGLDAYPTLDPTHAQVYAKGTVYCDGTVDADATFSNSAEGSTQPRHSYDDSGYCLFCGNDVGTVIPTEDGWYEISSFEQLRYFERLVNAGSNKIKGRLLCDVNMDNRLFYPIGTHNDEGPEVNFSGTFDGQGHVLTNLYVEVDDGQEAGLFGRVNGGGTIRNLGIINASINNNAGIRAGVFAGEIHACNVSYCFSGGDISITTDHEQKGGISGEAASSNLSNCYTTYDVLTNAAASVSNCYWGESAKEGAETGALCYTMNGNSFLNPTWYQTLGEDPCPVLDSSHGLVYPTGEDSYASALTDEQYKEMVANVVATEKAIYDEKIAANSLLESYISAISQLEEASYDEFLAVYVSLDSLRTQIAKSEKAYADYIEKLNQIKTYLNDNSGLQGPERDILDAYLDEEKPADETYPNGTSLYILKELDLDVEALKEEMDFAAKLLEIAIERCYQAGSEITSFLVNADFTLPEAEGWTYEMGSYGGGASAEGMKNVISTQNSPLDIYQTVEGLRPGIYEVRMNGYAEIEGAGPVCAYNYSSFIYANENCNYFHTPYTDLLTEEEKDQYPQHFGERYNSYGDVMGWGPNGWTGLCYAFGLGHFDNRILVNVTDGTLKLGVKTPGTFERNDDTFLGNARLIYHGTIEEASEGLDKQLENMAGIASHILNDYLCDNTDYYSAPNYPATLKTQLEEEVAQAATVTDNQQKYDLICRFGQTFMEVYKAKNAYVRMMAIVESLYTVVCEIAPDDVLEFEDTYYGPVVTAFFEGTYSEEEALGVVDKLKQYTYYRQYFGEEPELVDEEYICTTPYHLAWVSQQVNSGKNRNLHFALGNDIDMSEIANFTPIGYYVEGKIQNPFEGQFNGYGHIIRNLNVNVSNGIEAGFFGRAINSTIKNVGIVNAHIVNQANIRAGVLGGELHLSNIMNCFTAGDLIVETEYEQCTGFAGEAANSNLTNCYTTHMQLANKGSLENCYSALDELDFSGGELCYRLNEGRPTPIYYQTLGEDAYPVLDSTHGVVYIAGTLACDGTPLGDIAYSNEPDAEQRQPHEYDEHGFCVNCHADKGQSYADEDGVYHLASGYALRWFSNLVNDGKTGAKAVLDADIDMTGIEMQPIGRYSDDHEFDGTNRTYYGGFDGQGYEIRNLSMVITDRQEGGLFGRAAGSTQIRNFGLVNPTVINTHEKGCRLGAVCGELNGATISNVYVVGEITLNTSHVQLCSFAGEAASGKIVNCYTTSDLKLSNLGAHTNSYYAEEAREKAPTGELCYLLNDGETEEPIWRQTLTEDAYPVLRADHKIVYLGEDGYYNQEEGDGIEEIRMPAQSLQGVYTISGQKVQNDIRGLKKGIYIINGRKMVIK
ncbi:MAG: hypothetical protein ACI4B5_02340 [Bacteroidaceae bacterium]